jgi:tight adherence protein C
MPEFDPALLLTIFLAIGASASVGALALSLARRDKTVVRLKSVTERRHVLAVQSAEMLRAERRGTPRKLQQKSGTELLIARLKILQEDSLHELRRSMTMAGWRDPSAPAKFVAAAILVPVFLAVVGALLGAATAFDDVALKYVVIAGLACAGGFLPRLLLVNAIKKRQASITRGLPDALDLMVICVESGLSAEAAFNRVADELIITSPELGEEFGLLAAELAFLPDRRKPLENLAERTGLAAVKSLSTTLLQSEKYGTPIAVGLRVLAQENRESRMAAAEKKAAALPAKLTVPMVVFFLPVLFAVIAGPAGIRIASM